MKRPMVTGIALIALACSDDAPKTDDSWLGAPCEQCTLDTQLPVAAGATAEDCGVIPNDGGGDDAAACALAAYGAGRSFRVIEERRGIDSYVATGWIFDAKTARMTYLSYDSNICGGLSSSCSGGPCGPEITSFECPNHAESSTGASLFECDHSRDGRVVCGPKRNDL